MAKSIKLKNNVYIDSAGVSHNRETLKSLLNKLVVPAYIKVRQTTSQSLSTVGSLVVDFQVVDYNVGDCFSLSNGKVKVISDNVHHVRIHTELWVERGGTSYAWCHIAKNGSDLTSYMVPHNNGGEPWQSVSMEVIVAVSKNDTIQPHVYFNQANASNSVKGGTYSNSVFMTVEKID